MRVCTWNMNLLWTHYFPEWRPAEWRLMAQGHGGGAADRRHKGSWRSQGFSEGRSWGQKTRRLTQHVWGIQSTTRTTSNWTGLNVNAKSRSSAVKLLAEHKCNWKHLQLQPNKPNHFLCYFLNPGWNIHCILGKFKRKHLQMLWSEWKRIFFHRQMLQLHNC